MTERLSSELDVTGGVEAARPSPPAAWAMFLKECGRVGCGYTEGSNQQAAGPIGGTFSCLYGQFVVVTLVLYCAAGQYGDAIIASGHWG